MAIERPQEGEIHAILGLARVGGSFQTTEQCLFAHCLQHPFHLNQKHSILSDVLFEQTDCGEFLLGGGRNHQGIS